MTRETRIAMLVGLLFIIMFGLVLSELTKGQPAPAPLTATGEPGLAQRYTAVVEPVPGGGDTSATAADGADRSRPPAELARDTHDPCSVVDVRVWPSRPDRIDDPVVPGDSGSAEDLRDSLPTPPGPPAEPAGKKYIVKDKDTFVKIARTEYGPQNERQYTLIAKANPTVDPLRLRPGQELIIPPLPAAPPPSDRVTPGRTPAPPAPSVREMTMDELDRTFGRGRAPGADRPPVPDVRPPEPAKKYYVVQKGDNLAKIAREQLRSGTHASVMRLIKTNRLKDPDDLQIGMRLEIPS